MTNLLEMILMGVFGDTFLWYQSHLMGGFERFPQSIVPMFITFIWIQLLVWLLPPFKKFNTSQH